MEAMAGSTPNDAVIIEQAVRRGGVCLRHELLAAGLSPGVIDQRMRAGFLGRAGRGIYVVEQLRNRSTPLHLAVNLVAKAIVSHLTAAVEQNFPIERIEGDPVHVLAPHGYSRRLDGLVIHPRRRWPHGRDLVVIDGIPMTGPARTIVDVAALVGPARLRHVVQTQFRDGNPTMPELVACFEATARRGVTGAARLRGILAELNGDEPIGKSALEGAVAQLLVDNAISGFEPQYRPPWYDGWRGVADFAHPALRLILEADGRRWHRRDQEMAEDRRRDRLAAQHGWLTVRVTWAEVTQRPAATAADLEAIIATRSLAA